MFFIEEFNDKYGKHFRGLNQRAEQLLLDHTWPGNVRELRNSIERVVLLENEEMILGRHLHFLSPPSKPGTPGAPGGKFSVELPQEGIGLEDVDRTIILQAYEKCGKNKSRTARFLRLPRHILIYRLKKYGVDV